VSLAALAPTVLDLTGVSAPGAGFHASSLAPLLRAEPTSTEALAQSTVFLEVDFEPLMATSAHRSAHAKALISEGFKIIRHDHSGAVEIYDLRADPGEQRNLASLRPELRARLEPQLDRHIEMSREGAMPAASRSHSASEIEELRALGYAE
jgi:arylsulfatase A-like enzyme